jgi:AbrB family looped-hinge helix DNA binding protein
MLMNFKKTFKINRAVVLTIPKKICESVNLQPYDDVAVFVDNNGRIIIEKLTPEKFHQSMFEEVPEIT